MSAKTRILNISLLLLLSISLLLVCYHKLIFSLNTTFFSTLGDGIQYYYTVSYETKYDSSVMYTHSLNYPYGEYTLSQPLVVRIIKLISNNITDVKPYTIGIINAALLFSLIIAPLFLYLLFTELGMSAFPSILIAIGITFLSPQIDRFGGHYSLSYVFAIPMLFYLMLLYNKYRKLIYSLLICILVLMLTIEHVYYAGFSAFIILIYWFYMFISDKNNKRKRLKNLTINITIQLILPLLIFYAIEASFGSLSIDRPSKPGGFLFYKASPESVFLPLGTDYGRFLHKLWNFNYVQWEGISYTGLAATIGFFIILVNLIKKVIRKKWYEVFAVTDNDFINIIFWSSLVALLYSFGIPFIFGLRFLVDYIGPLQQLRAIARFSWLFFYAVNIVVFYKLWHWCKLSAHKLIPALVFASGIIMLFTDVCFYLKNRPATLNNAFPMWSDQKNMEPDNQWVSRIKPKQFQAIIPLPFYHMGSDNYSIDVRCNMSAYSFLVSLKTGLPVSAIYSGRASISQSLKNIALVTEPYRDFEIIKDLPDKRPFLIVASRCDELTDNEKHLIDISTKTDSSGAFLLYSLSYDSLASLPYKQSVEVNKEWKQYLHGITDTCQRNNMLNNIDERTFDKEGIHGYKGGGHQIEGRNSFLLYDDFVNHCKDVDYTISFWLSGINADLIPKTRIEIEVFDTSGVRLSNQNVMAGNCIKAIDQSWGLIEQSIHLNGKNERLRIRVSNNQIAHKQCYTIDELMIRPSNCEVFKRYGNYIVKNNRYFKALN
jgi:hypothetical protein